MKKLIYLLIGLFVLVGMSSCGGKSGAVSATKKSSGGAAGRSRDSFKGKSKKGPNVYSSGSRSKNKSKAYSSSVSRKKRRKGSGGSAFSSKKRRYKFVNSKPKKGDGGSKSSKGGRKSGKGRKK